MQDTLRDINKQYNLSNLEPDFREYLSAVINLKSVSIKNYLSDYRFFKGWAAHSISPTIQLSSGKPLDYIDTSLVAQYKDYLVASGVPSRTTNRRLSSLRAFCAFAVAQGWMTSNPAVHISNANTRFRKQSTSGAELDSFEKYLAQKTAQPHDVSVILQDVHEFLSITQS